jgi:hypothetical protein
MFRRRHPATLIPMAQTWRVIVVRAWLDGDTVRVRLLVDGDVGRGWVVCGTDEAVARLRSLLDELVALGSRAGEGTPPATSR